MAEILTVVGGGVTGLAAAYLAAKAGLKVRVLEEGQRFGGLLNTFEIGGSRLEIFYHHFFTHDRELAWLLTELGVDHHAVFANSTMGVYRKGRIYRFDSPADLLRFSPIGLLGKMRFVLTSLYMGKVASWREWEDVSASEWIARWAGADVSENLWRPLLNTKFGPYCDSVPMAWLVGRLRQRMNSRRGGREQLGYLGGSLEVLLQALLTKLRNLGVELLPETPVRGLDIQAGRLLAVETPAGRIRDGKFLFTIPTVFLPALLRGHCPDYANDLSQIQYFSVVCTILEMDRPLSDIYWLNIADSGFPFGGIIEHTNLVSPREYGGSHIAYLSRYFPSEDSLSTMSPTEIAEHMIRPLPDIFPAFRGSHVARYYVFRSRTAAPVCDLNFSRRVPACKSPIENLFLATMTHVYPDERSCNNSIRVAAEACRVMGCLPHPVPGGSSLSGQIGMSLAVHSHPARRA